MRAELKPVILLRFGETTAPIISEISRLLLTHAENEILNLAKSRRVTRSIYSIEPLVIERDAVRR